MVLIQLLLPTILPKGAAVHDATAALADTHHELAAKFDGVTAYLRSPARGIWTAPDGHTEQDDVVMMEVVTARFDEHWWRTYVPILRERFQQEAIHVRALTIQSGWGG